MASEQPPRRTNPPNPKPMPLQMLGMVAGLGFIAGSAIVGAYAYTRGNKTLGNKMVKTRMIVVATTMGFYMGSTNLIPPPGFLSSMFGQEPVSAQPLVLPGSRGSSSSSGRNDGSDAEWQQE